jgi:hypothetical protein
MHRLARSFLKHDKVRFTKWIADVKAGAAKVNAQQLFPHNIVAGYLEAIKEDDLVEEQWRELTKKYTNLGNCMVVVDVSGSMYSPNGANSPIYVSVAMGVLFSQAARSIWRDYIITFSEKPQIVSVKYTSLLRRIQAILQDSSGFNTDLQAVFELVLRTAKTNELPQQDMPEKIIIVSDMQFDEACNRNDRTNYQCIKEKYEAAGYGLPRLIFWNVNGKYGDIPLMLDDYGVLLSGFSPSIMRYVCGELSDEDFSPLGLMKQVLADPRYTELRTCVANFPQ